MSAPKRGAEQQFRSMMLWLDLSGLFVFWVCVLVRLCCLMFGLQPLVNVVRRARVFKRSKTPLEVKGLAALLCFTGLSYRGWLRLLVVYCMGW